MSKETPATSKATSTIKEDTLMANEKVNVKPNSIIAINLEDGDDKGLVQVTGNLIATIVKKYVMEVDGVLRTAPQSLVEGIATMLSHKNYDSSINIDLTPEGAIITLDLILRFGVSIPEIAREIQDTLFDRIEKLTGYKVQKVNINVIDLEEEEVDIDDEATVVTEK